MFFYRMYNWPYLGLGLISLVPLIIFDPFNPVGYTDPYLYFSCFTNFRDLIERYGTAPYFFARLPWIMIGSVIYSLFTPVIATYILRFLVFYLSAVSAFNVLGSFFGRGIGYVSVAVIVLNPYYGRAVMWDYPDGAVIAVLLAACWFLFTPPASLGRRGSLAGAGALLATSVFTLPACFPVAVASVCSYIVFKRKDRLKTLALDGLWLLAGAITLVLVVAICGKILMNEFLFFRGQLAAGLMMLKTDYVRMYWMPLHEWLPTSYRLVIFLAGPFVALLLILHGRQRTSLIPDAQRGFLQAMTLFSVLALTLYAALHLTTNGVPFQVYFGSSYLLAPTFLLVGAILGTLPTEAPDGRLAIAAVTVAITSLGVLVGAFIEWTMPPVLAWLVIAVAFSGAALLEISDSAISGNRRGVGMAVVLVALVTFPLVIDRTAPIKFWTYSDNYLNVFRSHEAGFRTVLKVQSLLTSGVLNGRRVLFWEDTMDTTAKLQVSLSCLYMCTRYDFSRILPEMSEEQKKSLCNPSSTVVMTSDKPEKFDRYMQILEKSGIEVTMRSRWRIEGIYNFEIMLVDVMCPA